MDKAGFQPGREIRLRAPHLRTRRQYVLGPPNLLLPKPPTISCHKDSRVQENLPRWQPGLPSALVHSGAPCPEGPLPPAPARQ